MPLRPYADALEELYARYNRRQYVSPDPLEVLYDYADPADREVVGLVAATLAYGRVAQILTSVRWVLDRLGQRPARTQTDASPARLTRMTDGFRHRFQTQAELRALLAGIRSILRREGSLEAAFAAAMPDGQAATGLAGLRDRLDPGSVCGHLLPDAARGSACKRLHLYLRWMVRRDAVDPGGWTAIGPDRLTVPLDTHMHAIASGLGATARKAADARTAREITDAFRRICPHDPVRYDFALTRWGIRPEMDRNALLRRMILQ